LDGAVYAASNAALALVQLGDDAVGLCTLNQVDP
jgi:hypothetical protein